MRCLTLLGLAFTIPACGDDPAPEIEIPPWAKVAPEQIAEAKRPGVSVAFENDLGMWSDRSHSDIGFRLVSPLPEPGEEGQ